MCASVRVLLTTNFQSALRSVMTLDRLMAIRLMAIRLDLHA